MRRDRAINEIGPANAVAAAVSTTPTSIISRRERSTRTPSAQAVSSPISSRRMRRASSAAAISISTISGAEGQVFPGQAIERAGIPQPGGESGLQRGAQQQPCIEGHQHGANADADNNQAKRFNAVAPGQQPDHQRGQHAAGHCRQRNRRQVLAEHHHRHQHATQAPVLKPITSGLPSGLRISD